MAAGTAGCVPLLSCPSVTERGVLPPPGRISVDAFSANPESGGSGTNIGGRGEEIAFAGCGVGAARGGGTDEPGGVGAGEAGASEDWGVGAGDERGV